MSARGRRLVLPLLATAGVLIAVVVMVRGNPAPPASGPPLAPSRSPYPAFVAGTGVVEASTGNIAVGTPVAGIVTDIQVALNQTVAAGDPLFKIDDRALQAKLVVARAQVKQAAAALRKPRHKLDYARGLKQRDPEAVSGERLSELSDDVAAAEAALARARAEVRRLELERERHTVRAPVAGRILRLNMRLGEYVEPSGGTPPMLILGSEQPLYVRVNIDQEDAWRVRPEAAATGFQRGRPGHPIALQFEYIEPRMVPKTELTGRSTERTDTRVLQVLYSFPPEDQAVHVGQQLDVFIQAPPVTTDEG